MAEEKLICGCGGKVLVYGYKYDYFKGKDLYRMTKKELVKPNSVTLYRKLRDYWGLEKLSSYHSTHGNPSKYSKYRYINLPQSPTWWHRIRWMPSIADKIMWRRLTYAEFCQAYNLEMIPI